MHNDNSDAVSDTGGSWREVPRATSTFVPAHNNYNSRNQNTTSEPVVSKAEESDNWRSAKKRTLTTPGTPATVPQQPFKISSTEANAKNVGNNGNTTASGKTKFIPPSLLKKLAENV